MVDVAIEDLNFGYATGRRVLGFDVGGKTIGLALSDLGWLVATPLLTIRRTKFRQDAEILRRLIEEHAVGALIIGLPINMDGSEGSRAQSTRQFATNLSTVTDLPMAFWDERLSSAAIERVLIDEVDMSRRRRREVIDKTAAAYILQGALDRLGHLRADKDRPR